MTFIIVTVKLAALLWTIAVSLAEAMFWAVHLLIGGVRIGVDAVLIRRRASGGVLTCPRGHHFSVSDDDNIEIECSCGWRSKGNALKCANPECTERSAPFVSCWCGLSVRNPYRLGRPR
ncbi:MAG: hypothetical protein RKU31_01725 [Deltaproteobacteria bacterium]|jgi:hypothetical protein